MFIVSLSILFITAMNVWAINDITLVASNVNAQYKSIVEVPVSISNNTDLMGFGFEISYDEEFLEPASVEMSSLLSAGTFDDSIGTKYTNPFRVIWSNTSALTSNGKIFTLKFNAKKSGSTKVSISCMKDDTYDSNYNKININTIDVNINVVCNHTYSKTTTLAATCTTKGIDTYTCSICGDKYEQYTDKKSHTYTTKTTAATCTNAGSKEHTCSVCGYSYSEVINATGHNYNSVVTAPTCTAKGYTTHTCTKCNNSYVSNYTNIIAHTYSSKITKEATCTSEGIKTYTCTMCGTSYNEAIAKKSHTYKNVITEPTCTSKGYTTHNCSMCGDSYVDSYTEMIAHTPAIDAKVDATCIRSGLTEGSHCSKCGKVLVAQQIIPKTNHSYTSKITKQATCTTKGIKTYTCKICSDSYTEDILPTGHQYEDVVTEPTCTSKGYTTHTCDKCNSTYVDTYTDMIEHTSVKDRGRQATCVNTGITEGSHCGVCGKIIVAQKVIPKKEHDYVKETVSPTCTSSGYDKYVCSMCGDEYRDNYSQAKGHIIVKDEYKAPTCTTTGLTEGSHCSECEAVIVIQQEIPKTEHVYEKSITDATCLNEGFTVYTCKYCGDNYKDDIKPALGHKYVLVNKVESTESVKGHEDYECALCKDKYSKELELKAPTTKPSENPTGSVIIKKNQKITTAKIKKVKASILKKKSVKIKLKAKTNGKGKLTYKVKKYPKKMKKFIKVSKKGVVTFKKKAKKGTYKIAITAAANNNYNKAVKIITIKVK